MAQRRRVGTAGVRTSISGSGRRGTCAWHAVRKWRRKAGLQRVSKRRRPNWSGRALGSSVEWQWGERESAGEAGGEWGIEEEKL